MGLGKKAKREAKAVKGRTQERCRQGQAQGGESQECREALTGLPQLYITGPEVGRPGVIPRATWSEQTYLPCEHM
jgi:hypothetical protein